MEENKTNTQTEPLNLSDAELQAITKLDKTIDIEAAPKNSVLVVKLNPQSRDYANNLQRGIIETILKPRFELLKEKKLTVLFMASNDDIALLSEEDMARAGWVKKEPSLIITP